MNETRYVCIVTETWNYIFMHKAIHLKCPTSLFLYKAVFMHWYTICVVAGWCVISAKILSQSLWRFIILWYVVMHEWLRNQSAGTGNCLKLKSKDPLLWVSVDHSDEQTLVTIPITLVCHHHLSCLHSKQCNTTIQVCVSDHVVFDCKLHVCLFGAWSIVCWNWSGK